MPEITDEISILSLTSKPENQGLLDPYVTMKKKKDSESLATDILTSLIGIPSRDGKRFPVSHKAVRTVAQSDQQELLQVINELQKNGSLIAENIVNRTESFTDYGFAHLLFLDGSITQSISLDRQLNIIQVTDSVLPNTEVTFEEYTTTGLLSTSMLIAISTFALNFIHSDREIFRIVNLDEARSFLQVAQGKTLSNKLVHVGRAMNAGVYSVTQNSDDLLDEHLENNIGLKLVFCSTDIREIKEALELFGLDQEDQSDQKRLRDLENGITSI